MFVSRSLVLVLVLATLLGLASSRTFSRCELARELVRRGIPRSNINDWVCLVESESGRRTNAIGSINKNGSRDYGLFQINNKYWCSETGPAGKDCNVRCRDLTDDDIGNDVQCALKVFKRHGFSAWNGWKSRCQGGRASSVASCF